MVPHITDAIQDWVTKVSGEPVENTTKADVCLIEVSKHQKNIALFALFLLIFVRTKFSDFHVLEKIAKIDTREKKRVRKLNMQNLIPDLICKKTIHGF